MVKELEINIKKPLHSVTNVDRTFPKREKPALKRKRG